MLQQADGNGRRVLVVEDDPAMALALRDGFESEGYAVLTANDGLSGLRLAEQESPDLLILDVMLPELSGLDVCQRLRARSNQLPIIMLTARGQEVDKVLGLKLGADDYVTKPFSLMELLARAESVLRRSSDPSGEASAEMPESCRFGDVSIDFRRHQARKKGRRLDLSAREFLILRHFLHHRGRVVSRDQLLDAVWGYDSIPFTRTVDTHMSKLRKKIEDDPANPRHLITVHRLGYKFTG